jgi:hypothetical protein
MQNNCFSHSRHYNPGTGYKNRVQLWKMLRLPSPLYPLSLWISSVRLFALMFLYNRFLNKPIEQLNFKYAQKPIRIPTVFTHEEAVSVINAMVMPYKLMA